MIEPIMYNRSAFTAGRAQRPPCCQMGNGGQPGVGEKRDLAPVPGARRALGASEENPDTSCSLLLLLFPFIFLLFGVMTGRTLGRC